MYLPGKISNYSMNEISASRWKNVVSAPSILSLYARFTELLFYWRQFQDSDRLRKLVKVKISKGLFQPKVIVIMMVNGW